MIRRKWLGASVLFVVAAIAFVYYAPSLQFGFFNDDPTGHFRWMEGRSVWSLLTDASGHGYYRPFSFILWQLLHSSLGRHAAFVLHLLNVLAHASNAALVAWLAHKLTARLTFASLAGLLFALYPFSYEAVPYVGSFVHPLVTGLILLSLAFYLCWQSSRSWPAFAAAHVALTLAVLTHENAVITPLLMVGLELLRRDPSPRSRPALAQASFFAEPALFAVLWLLVPKTAAARALSLDAMRANVLPFVQALVYPIAPLANHNPAALAVLAALAWMALLVLAWRARALRIAGWGLLIWLLASLPSILILDNAYVLGSPRLFYLASVGIALVWALPVLAVERVLKGVGYWKYGVWLLTFALCTLPSAANVRCQLAYQGLAGEVGQMMAKATRATPEGQPVTFVNLPYFFSSRGPGTECSSPFVFAPTGAVVIPPYADARDFAYYNGGPDRPTLAVTLREYQPGWQTFGPPTSVERLRAQLAARSRVFVFDLLRWRLLDLSAAWQPSGRTEQVQYTVGDLQISNVKFQMSKEQVETGLTWQVTKAVKELKVFAHVYDGGGKLVAQDDNLPVDGFAPAAWWQAGDVITDTRTIQLGGLPAGAYRVTMGMYDAATGARLEAYDASGSRLPDDEIPVGQVTR